MICSICPRAIGIGDGSRPAFRGAGRCAVQHECAFSANPEYGRLRLRNHAPQAVILFDDLHVQVPQAIAFHGVLELAPPARRVQSVEGASAKAPDSGEQPSATKAPGAEQVEHTSSGASESGEVKDAPRLESHVVDLFSVGTAVTTTALSTKSRNAFQRRWCWVWLFFVIPTRAQAIYCRLAFDA